MNAQLREFQLVYGWDICINVAEETFTSSVRIKAIHHTTWTKPMEYAKPLIKSLRH